MSTGASVRYLPLDFVTRLGFVLADVEDEHLVERVRKLVCDAYTDGYADGHTRGLVEGDGGVRAEWARQRAKATTALVTIADSLPAEPDTNATPELALELGYLAAAIKDGSL